MIFFSADGNFEVTLATKATLFHNGLVEVSSNGKTNKDDNKLNDISEKKITIYNHNLVT